MTDLAIEVRGLRKRYRGFALRDVSFAVPRGYVCGLIGPNGAGKTTVIKAILNLVRRDAGEIRVLGLDNLAEEAAVKSRVGFVYDAPCFYEDVSLRDHARAIAPFYGRWDEAEFARLAGEFELPLGRKYKTLSHGMRTKFALALALAHHADLLILDEPTTGLDPAFRRDLLKRLRGLLQDEGKSVLFSTHITSDLERIADFVTFIRGGEIVFSLPTAELLERWAIVRGDEAVLATLPAAARRGVRRGAFNVEVLTSDAEEARRRLGAGAVIERPSLDDIMVLMTGGERHAA